MKITYATLGRLAIVATMLTATSTRRSAMELGNFSVSLAVKDIKASSDFYGKLGFVQVGGEAAKGWTILKNGDTKIGLFQGMFDKNALTFNPGWNSDGKPSGPFEDVRSIQKRLKDAGIDAGADIESASGPAHIMLTDPDGNPVLIDQHL